MARALRVVIVATLFLVPLAIASVVTAHAVPLPGDVIAAAPRAAGLPAAAVQQPGKATRTIQYLVKGSGDITVKYSSVKGGTVQKTITLK
jgi:hypothetical protein